MTSDGDIDEFTAFEPREIMNTIGSCIRNDSAR